MLPRGVLVKADTFSGVFVVILDACASSGAGAFADSVSIVEPEQPFSILVVQRERIDDAVRSFRRWRNPLDDELDPAFAGGIRDEVSPSSSIKCV